MKGAPTAAAFLLLGVGCSSPTASAGVAIATRQLAPTASATATINGDYAMIALVQDLVSLLSRNPLTIEDVTDRVGPVGHDPGGLMPIELRPVLAGVRAASLARDPDSGLPYLLTLELAPGTQLTVAMLRQAFGDYQRLRTDRGHPPQIVFSPPGGTQWKVALIADLQSAAAAFDDQSVTSLSLLRERVSS
jgi:hypothetical protein